MTCRRAANGREVETARDAGIRGLRRDAKRNERGGGDEN